MYNFIVIIMIIIAVLLVLAVLVQRSKGGGFSSSVNATQFMGVQKGTDFIEKTTWTLAIALFSLCLVVSIMVKNQGPVENKSKLENVDKESVAPPAPPANNGNTTTPEGGQQTAPPAGQ